MKNCIIKICGVLSLALIGINSLGADASQEIRLPEQTKQVLKKKVFEHIKTLKSLKQQAEVLSESADQSKVAISRYKKWMRLRAKYPTSQHQPPRDILLMWHVHMLHPVTYRKDLTKLAEEYQTTVESIEDGHVSADLFKKFGPLSTFSQRTHQRRAGKRSLSQLWQQEYSISLKQDKAQTTDANSDSWTISLDLWEALRCQIPFFRKVSNLDAVYKFEVDDAIERYENFLNLAKDSKVSPTVDIDMIWHTHQRMHTEYIKFFESQELPVLDHDDDMGEDIQQELNESTKALWSGKYSTPYDNKYTYGWQTYNGQVAVRSSTRGRTSTGSSSIFSGFEGLGEGIFTFYDTISSNIGGDHDCGGGGCGGGGCGGGGCGE